MPDTSVTIGTQSIGGGFCFARAIQPQRWIVHERGKGRQKPELLFLTVGLSKSSAVPPAAPAFPC
ncbi:MAG: hypothetical protein ABI810_06405 [Sphingomonas bacterium]